MYICFLSKYDNISEFKGHKCSVCLATSHSQEMKKKLSYKNLLYFALVMLIMKKTFYGSKKIIEYKYNERNNKLPLMEQTVNKIFNKQELLTHSFKKRVLGINFQFNMNVLSEINMRTIDKLPRGSGSPCPCSMRAGLRGLDVIWPQLSSPPSSGPGWQAPTWWCRSSTPPA